MFFFVLQQNVKLRKKVRIGKSKKKRFLRDCDILSKKVYVILKKMNKILKKTLPSVFTILPVTAPSKSLKKG